MIILVIVLFIAYEIRTNNMLIIKPINYKTIFDYIDSEWVCDNIGVELKVYDINEHQELGLMFPAIMNININGEKKDYVMCADYLSKIIVFDKNNVNDAGELLTDSEYELLVGNARYRKNLSGEVTKMTIYDIRKDKIFNNKYKKLVFKRK